MINKLGKIIRKVVQKGYTIQLLFRAPTAGLKCQTHHHQTPLYQHQTQRVKTWKQASAAHKNHTTRPARCAFHSSFYKVQSVSYCSGRCAYLTERISCLFPLILRRMNPTRRHHSTWLKILLFVDADIEEGTSSRVQKICPTWSNSHLNSCLMPYSICYWERGRRHVFWHFIYLTHSFF